MRRMRALMRAAAAAGGAASLCYCVVDMVPEPVRCTEAEPDSWVFVEAEWVRAEDDDTASDTDDTGAFAGWNLQVWFFTGVNRVAGVVLGDLVEFEGARIVEFSPEDGPVNQREFMLLLEPFPDATEVVIGIRTACNGEPTLRRYRIVIDPDQVGSGSLAVEQLQ